MSEAPSHLHHFVAAGQRHLSDGRHLHAAESWAGADHLAGMAAECTLKAILLRFLGASMGKAKPQTVDQSGKQVSHGHLPALWHEVVICAQGRRGASLISRLQSSNPWDGWDIADRYRDGTSITKEAATSHLCSAEVLGDTYQRLHRDEALS